MALRRTDPESCITEYTLVYEEWVLDRSALLPRTVGAGLARPSVGALQGYLAHKKHPPRRTLQ